MKKSNLLLSFLILLSFLLSGCFAKKGIDPFILKAKFNGKLIQFQNRGNEPIYSNGSKKITIKGHDSDDYLRATRLEFEFEDTSGFSNKVYYPEYDMYRGISYSKFSSQHGIFLHYLTNSIYDFKITIISRSSAGMKGVFEGKVFQYQPIYPNEIIYITEGEFNIPDLGDD